MNLQHFWKGVGLGVAAGAVLGVKLKTEEKHIKRSVNKAKRNMGSVIDSMGI